MNQFFEAAIIALGAIWSNKLRSFLTVLGNIVAVTSIIAVVSLIQGLNASVKQAIQSQAGTDSFVVQRYPVTRTDEDFDRVRNKYGRRSLQTGRTAFDKATSDDSWRHDHSIGLSAQIE